MKTEIIHLTANENVTLASYLLDSSSEMSNTSVRPAVLIFPGGGYWRCSDREAEPIAMAFLAEGYHAFILRYSINENAAFPKPLNDAEEALELIRSKAAECGVNPEKIAVCGFSAGGHLAIALGTMGRVRPNALILGYPAILETISDSLPAPVPSLDKMVDQHTPPAFIFTTANDSLVPMEHSFKFVAALDKAHIPFELHIFQNGAHGLSLGKPHTSGGFKIMVNRDVAKWIGLCTAWLENLFGGFPADGHMPVVSDARNATEYSVDLPLEVCWTNPECQRIIIEYIPELASESNRRMTKSVSVRMITEYSKRMDELTLVELDQKLRAISFS